MNERIYHNVGRRGRSSTGRALPLQGRGYRFEPGRLHPLWQFVRWHQIGPTPGKLSQMFKATGSAVVNHRLYASRVAVLAVVILVVTVLPGCHAKSRSPKDADMPTRRSPQIVSTVPAATQILLQLKAGDALAAVSTYDKPLLTGRWRKLPVIGNYIRLNTELMVQIHPTGLVMQMAPSLIPVGIRNLCHHLDCQIIDIKLNSLRDLESTTLRLGSASGSAGRAREAVNRLRRQIASMERHLANWPAIPVVYCLSSNPLRIVGGGNFMNDEIHLAGGKNVGRLFGNGFPKITHAELLQLHVKKILIWHPEKVFRQGYQWLMRHYGNKLCCIRWPDADLLTLNVVQKIRRIRALIHPSTDPAQAASTPARKRRSQ